MEIFYEGESWDVKFERYNNCGNIKIILENKKNGNKKEVTLGVEEYMLKRDEILVKNYSEFQGIEEALINGGIINSKPSHIYDYGFTKLKTFKLSGYALRKISLLNTINKNKKIAS